jgi:serine/threonine-protein kinase
MVTGAPPYPVGTWEELVAARQQRPAALPPGIPPAFAGLVTSCLAEEPGHRPPAAQVTVALRALSRQSRAGGPGPGGPATGRAFDVGRASPVVMTVRQQATPAWYRRPAVAVTATAVAAAAAFAVGQVGSAHERTSGGPVPATARPTATATAVPKPAASRPPGQAAPEVRALSIGEAVDRLRSTVDEGRAAGEIRSDVAQDLVNLIRPLEPVGGGQPDPATVADVRRKVDERAREGSITRRRAELLQARLTQFAAGGLR